MFWERFYELCCRNNIKPNPLGKILGISSGVITKWKYGSLPTADALLKIADYFNVSVDYLIGHSTPTGQLTSLLVEQASTLSNDDLKKVIEYAELLKSKNTEQNDKK